jgi:hypothetical protein
LLKSENKLQAGKQAILQHMSLQAATQASLNAAQAKHLLSAAVSAPPQ